jgi:LCP family protein required for cell wall assembly
VLLVAYKQGGNIQRVDIGDSAAPVTAAPGTTPATAPGVPPQSTSVGTVVATSTDPGQTTPSDPSAPGTASASTQPAETFPPADPTAKNFLITGADNNACVDPDSPYAPAFGDREGMGERSDTIMIMRVDPANSRAAILSFPRDLWVRYAGGQNQGRINGVYVRDDPRRLIDTIVQNFGIGIDHFVQVDFCAFKRLVDGVGGVTVPFDYPARDTHTGLYVPEAVCYTFNGDHALAYVRSRYYQYFEDGKWKNDGTSDLGRISRQQDFIRRALRAALDQGIYTPSVARSLLDIATQFIVVDTNLTPSKMFEFAGILRNFDPATIRTYQIEATPATISNQAVLRPAINGENMKSILRIFQGVAPLANAPEQVFETTTTTAPADGSTTTTGGTTTTTSTPSTTVVSGPTTSIVEGPASNDKGIVPPDREC